MTDQLSPAEVEGWAVALGVRVSANGDADGEPTGSLIGSGVPADPAAHPHAAELSSTMVRAHCAALDPPLSRRGLQRAISDCLVERPARKGRGRGVAPVVEYPPAVLAQLDHLAAARRATHDPARVRQRIWWDGGPAGATEEVRAALFRRVRADWDVGLRPLRALLNELTIIKGDPADRPETAELALVLEGSRGVLRATGLRRQRWAGSQLWAVAIAAALAGHRGTFVTPGGRRTPVGQAFVRMVWPGLKTWADLTERPEFERVIRPVLTNPQELATFACEILGPEFVLVVGSPVADVPQAEAEAARLSLHQTQDVAATLTAVADRLAIPRWAFPNLARLGVGDDPVMTALMVLAAFDAERLRRAWYVEPQASA